MSKPNLEKLTFQGPRGPIEATLARPAGSGPFPAVLLLQEGIGVTAHLRTLAVRFADAGYLTFVPDLYTRDEPRKLLRDEDVIRALPLVRADNREALIEALPSAERESARQVVRWLEGRDTSSYFPDVQAAVAFLKRHKGAQSDAVATVGFSMGGGLSAQLAGSGADLAAGVIFYGTGPAEEQTGQLRYPLLGHYAEHDPGITPHVATLAARLEAHGKEFISHVYPGTEHGFFNESRPVYRRAAAELAFQRTLDFFARQLASGRTRRGDTARASHA